MKASPVITCYNVSPNLSLHFFVKEVAMFGCFSFLYIAQVNECTRYVNAGLEISAVRGCVYMGCFHVIFHIGREAQIQTEFIF